MFGPINNKNKTLLGIDISSTSIKLIELSCSRGKYRVEAFSSEELESGAIVENDIKNTEIVGAAIAKAVKSSRSKCRNAAISVSGAAVITKMIQMNASLSDSEMESQISVEADQYIPYPLNEVAIDFEVQSLNQTNPELAEVLLAACRRENVEIRTEALDISGIKTEVVDVEAFVMERSFSLVEGQLNINNNSITAIVDIGSVNTSLYVIKEGKIIYTREQQFGGKQLTDKIIAKYDMSPEDAERAKKKSSLPDDYNNSILKEFIEMTIQQISRSLQFFYSSSEFNDVETIMLTGGSASVMGLAEAVQNKLGTTTMLANPFNQMTISKKVNENQIKLQAPELMIACGLAMRGFDNV